MLIVEVNVARKRRAARDVARRNKARPAAADLKAKGAEFSMEPKDLRPGLRIAFVRAPGDVRIELLERSD